MFGPLRERSWTGTALGLDAESRGSRHSLFTDNGFGGSAVIKQYDIVFSLDSVPQVLPLIIALVSVVLPDEVDRPRSGPGVARGEWGCVRLTVHLFTSVSEVSTRWEGQGRDPGTVQTTETPGVLGPSTL